MGFSISRRLKFRLEILVLLVVGFCGSLILANAGLIELRSPLGLLVLFSPLAIYFLFTSRKFNDRYVLQARTRVIPFEEFKDLPDCLVAPNHPQFEREILDVLNAYVEANGRGSVRVESDVDEQHLANSVYLIGAPLSAAERKRFESLKADKIKRALRSRVKAFLPDLSTECEVTEIVWD